MPLLYSAAPLAVSTAALAAPLYPLDISTCKYPAKFRPASADILLRTNHHRRDKLTPQKLWTLLMYIDRSIQNYHGLQADFIVSQAAQEVRATIRRATAIVTERIDKSKDAMVRYHLSQVAREVASISVEIERRLRLSGSDAQCLVLTMDREVSALKNFSSYGIKIINCQTSPIDVTPTVIAEITFGMLLNALLRDALQNAPANSKVTVQLKNVGQTVSLELTGVRFYSERDLLARVEHPPRTRALIAALGGHFHPIPKGVAFMMPLAALANSPWLDLDGTSRP